MVKEILSCHNKMFKNNEPFVKYKASDFIINKEQNLDIDASGLFLNDDDTASTASLTLTSVDEESNFISDSDSVLSEESAGNAPPSDIEYCNEVFDEPTCELVYNVPVPKNKDPRLMSLTPISIAVVDTVGLVKSRKLLKVLFDPGSTRTLIKKSVVPRKAVPIHLNSEKRIKTIAGSMNTSELVKLRNIRLPEFDKNRQIEETKAFIFDNESKYDIIFGADFLSMIGIVLDYRHGHMEWYGNTLPMREPWDLSNKEFVHMADAYLLQEEEEDLFGDDWFDSYAIEKILDAKYDKLDVNQVISEQKHLDSYQKQGLRDLFLKYQKVFDGSLGLYPHKKVHIEIDPNAKPVHKRAYAVPRVHLDTFKKELDHLVEIGVLSPQGMSEWASPSFIIPKKDGRVRWVSDLRALNEVVVRRQYPLPVIKDVLKKRTGYNFFTKIDVSMQYYTFELDDESKDLCTIATPVWLV